MKTSPSKNPDSVLSLGSPLNTDIVKQAMAAQFNWKDERQAVVGLGGQCCGGLRIPLGQLLLLDCYTVNFHG